MDSAYIGRIGSLIPVIQFRGGSSLDVERQSTQHRLLSGAIRVQVAPVANREWSCSVPLSHLEEHAGLKALVYAQTTQPPVFVPVDAPTSNVLTPERSQPGEFGGWVGDGAPVEGVRVPGVGVVRALRSAGGLVTIGGFSTPVVEDLPVTGSVYLGRADAGAVRVELSVFNAGGALLTTEAVEPVVSGRGVVRVLATIPKAPPAAAYAQLRVTRANTIACAAVTWTGNVLPWVPGAAASSVFVGGWSAGLEVLDVMTREPVESMSFTVTEVG